MASAQFIAARSAKAGQRRRLLRWAFAVALTTLLVLAVLNEWGAMRPHITELSPWAVVAALVLVLLALLSSMMSWRALLSDLGAHVPISSAARIFLVGQLAKYIPGGVWPVMASMELGRDHEVPRKLTGTATLLLFPLNVVTAVGLGALTLPFAPGGNFSGYAWSLFALPPCVAVLHPRVLAPITNRVARLLRREPLPRVASLRGMARAGLWCALSIVLSGLHIYVLAVALGAQPGKAAYVGVGAWAIAWTVGFLLIPFPGGIGPRDLALVQLLRPVLAVGAGTVVVIASRLIFTAAEVLAAVLAGRLAAHARRTPPSPQRLDRLET
jgi:uncharacterized membrane protein YbhN (UPF0104 family)